MRLDSEIREEAGSGGGFKRYKRISHGHGVLRAGLSYLRTKELLLRWAELSSVVDVVFRTHPGNLPDKSAQVNLLLLYFGFGLFVFSFWS